MEVISGDLSITVLGINYVIEDELNIDKFIVGVGLDLFMSVDFGRTG